MEGVDTTLALLEKVIMDNLGFMVIEYKVEYWYWELVEVRGPPPTAHTHNIHSHHPRTTCRTQLLLMRSLSRLQGSCASRAC